MGSSLMDEQLTSSCLTVYLKFRLFLLTEKPAISTYRTLADVILRVLSNSIALFRYDKLVIAVGSVSSTHGVSGLEHCFQLKTIADAQAIRRRILGGYFLSPSTLLQQFVSQITSRLPHSRQLLKKSVSGCSASWCVGVVQPVLRQQLYALYFLAQSRFSLTCILLIVGDL